MSLSSSERSLAPGLGSASVALTATSAPQVVVRPSSPLYLYHPLADLMIVGGGITLLVIPFALLVSPVFGAMAFMVLNLVCNYPHYMATNYRVYGSRTQLRRYRFFAVYATTALVVLAFASHLFIGAWVNLLVVAYLFLGPYHYTGQNYGIALMYARRGGVDVTVAEKWLLYTAGIAFMLTYLLLVTVRPMGITPILGQLELPVQSARIAHVVLFGIGAACAATFFRRLARRTTWDVLAPLLCLIAAQCAWFALPSAMVFFNQRLWVAGLNLALFVPAINFLHSAQYLGVTAYYTKRERATAAQPFHLGRYLLILVVGGAVLWSVSMRVFSEAFAVDYAVTVLALNALINLHHYVLDGAIWKLRDGRIARLLIASETPATVPVSVSRPASHWWSIGRGLAWGAVAFVALAFFSADAVRDYMVLEATTLRGAHQWQAAEEFYRGALRFNGRTGDAVEGLAAAAMQAGDFETAAQHWAASVDLNPISAHLRDGLAESYLKLGRVDEALAQLEHALRLAPDDEIALRLMAQAQWAKGDRAQAHAFSEQADAAAAKAERQRAML